MKQQEQEIKSSEKPLPYKSKFTDQHISELLDDAGTSLWFWVIRTAKPCSGTSNTINELRPLFLSCQDSIRNLFAQ